MTFGHRSITFLDFKSLQIVPKTLQVLKTKQNFFLKMSKYRNTVFYDFKFRNLVIFSSNYRHRLVLKIPFSDHIFLKIAKLRTKNLHFTSTGKYTPPPPLYLVYSMLKRPFPRHFNVEYTWCVCRGSNLYSNQRCT